MLQCQFYLNFGFIKMSKELLELDLHIKIGDVKVTEVTATSGIFSGENYHTHWSAMSKSNIGLNLGDSSRSTGCINIVYDPDLLSMFRVPVAEVTLAKKQVKTE
jgi:hypothetical protein